MFSAKSPDRKRRSNWLTAVVAGISLLTAQPNLALSAEKIIGQTRAAVAQTVTSNSTSLAQALADKITGEAQQPNTAAEKLSPEEIERKLKKLARMEEGLRVKESLYFSDANEINRKYMSADTIALVRVSENIYKEMGWAGKVVPIGIATMLRLTQNEDPSLAKGETGDLVLVSAGHNDTSASYRLLTTKQDPDTGKYYFDLDSDPETLPEIKREDFIKHPTQDIWILPASKIAGKETLPHFQPNPAKPIYKGRPIAGSRAYEGEIIFYVSGERDNVHDTHRLNLRIYDTTVTTTESGNPLQQAGGRHVFGESGKGMFRAYFGESKEFLNLDLLGVFKMGIVDGKNREGYIGSVFVDAAITVRNLIKEHLPELRGKKSQTSVGK